MEEGWKRFLGLSQSQVFLPPSHPEVWKPRDSQKGPTPRRLMIFAILRAAESCPGFPTHPYIVILQGFHRPAQSCRALHTHTLPKNHHPLSRASRSRKPSTASLADSIPGENKQKLPRKYGCSHSGSREEPSCSRDVNPCSKAKPWQGEGSLQLSCTITTQNLVLCTPRTL